MIKKIAVLAEDQKDGVTLGKVTFHTPMDEAVEPCELLSVG